MNKKVDVVYFLKETLADNMELRYSLRSLNNIKHDRVFIIWHKPKWVQNIFHIPFNDGNRKGFNTSSKLFFACNEKKISKDFILMADDIFILQKIEELKFFKLWTFKDYLMNIFWNDNNYITTIRETAKIYPDGVCYDTHTPFLINKKKMLKIFDKFPIWCRGSKRSLYCIENNIEWVFGNFPDYKWNKNQKLVDCKYYWWRFTVLSNQEFLSISDNVANYIDIVNFFKKTFPKKCKYEN
jgi:hypothetical protein